MTSSPPVRKRDRNQEHVGFCVILNPLCDHKCETCDLCDSISVKSVICVNCVTLLSTIVEKV